ncbi:MAG TPA: hypothetical protein VF814_04625 [Casimicrobiaceae bacterium]
MRLKLELGSKVQRLVNLDAPAVSWPDRDIRFEAAGGPRIEDGGHYVQVVDQRIRNLGELRAIALNYETDWDFVTVNDGKSTRLLGPGELMRFADDVRSLILRPHVVAPSTRMYDASELERHRLQAPTAPAGWTADLTNHTFINNTGGPVTLLKWIETYWEADETVADGATATHPRPDGDTHNNRASDYSFDGGAFNFADYMEAGLLLELDGSTLEGVARQSNSVFDSRGREGYSGEDPGAYATADDPAVFADLSPGFYGRLIVDLWTGEDCPSSSYRPRLAPVRYLRLGEFGLTGVADHPETPIVTLPCMNVERVGCRFKNAAGSAGVVYAQLVQPRGEDWIDQVAGVADPDPSSGDLFYTVAAGDTHELLLEEPTGPFVKLNMGTAGATATIVRGAVIALVRRVA